MFNAKEMKLLKDYKMAQKYLLDGVPVFMVGMDGSLSQITESTSWQKILFHNLQQGILSLLIRWSTCFFVRVSFIVLQMAISELQLQ